MIYASSGKVANSCLNGRFLENKFWISTAEHVFQEEESLKKWRGYYPLVTEVGIHPSRVFLTAIFFHWLFTRLCYHSCLVALGVVDELWQFVDKWGNPSALRSFTCGTSMWSPISANKPGRPLRFIIQTVLKEVNPNVKKEIWESREMSYVVSL